MAPRQLIFTDDLIVRAGPRGDEEMGVVDRAPNSSDEDSEIDDDDIIDDTEERADGKLPPGAARVRWRSQDALKTEQTSSLRLADRVFLLGDIVARASDQLGQTGIVTGMRMFCDVRCGEAVLRRLPTKVLQPLAACRPGALVVHPQAHWLGRVDEIYDNVQITFADGSSCKVLRTSANSLAVHSPTMDEQTWFWPGMQVSGTRDILRRAKWIKGSFRSSYVGVHATVVKVQAAQALVRWLAATPVIGSAEAVSIDPPAEMQRPSRLHEMHEHHARACWRLGEHATLLPADFERLKKEQGHEEEEAPAEATTKKQRSRKKAVDTCVEVIGCHTRVDVVWQDGRRDDDVLGIDHAPAKHVDGYYEFWPGDFIVGKSASGEAAPPVGVVESVDHDQRLCVVTWREGNKREVMPVYEIAPHPDFNFKVGDTVLRLFGSQEGDEEAAAPADGAADGADAPAAAPAAAPPAAAAEAPKPSAGGFLSSLFSGQPAAAGGSGAKDDGDGDDDDDDAPGGGGTVRLGDILVGEIVVVGPMLKVRWMDGAISEVPPEELYVVNTEEEEEPPEEEDIGSYDEEEIEDDAGHAPRNGQQGQNGGDDSSGWETVDDDDDGGEGGVADAPDADIMDAPDAAPAAAPAAAPTAAVPAPEPSEAADAAAVEDAPMADDDGGDADDENYETADDMEEDEAPAAATPAAAPASSSTAASASSSAGASSAAAEQAAQWRDAEADAALGEVEQFWVEEDGAGLSDHHYAAQGSSTASGAQFAKTCQKQWKLLQAGLPVGIYVAAFAERVDLLRAFVVGPPGTPYQDAAFVFDLQLPPEFPQQPPAVHYLSHGERVNPNLYENGKVCLSLLGTWTGRQSCELWNPESSTVLQVLVSIQALVLCEQPYYNEAGYEKQQGTNEGAHHARRYNEGALLLSLKSIMNTLKYPTAPFAQLTTLHFRAARRRIVGCCRKLVELKAESPPPSATGTDAEGKAAPDSAVGKAGLAGMLNPMPSLGFLHSLERSLPPLEATFAALDEVRGDGAEAGS